jgi:hypothetical protein
MEMSVSSRPSLFPLTQFEIYKYLKSRFEGTYSPQG